MSDPITPLTPKQTTVQEAQAAHEGYIHRVLVAGDQFLAVLGGGPPDVTISTDAALAAVHGKAIGKIVSKLLDAFQRDHGAKAAAGDTERAKNAQSVISQADVLNQKKD